MNYIKDICKDIRGATVYSVIERLQDSKTKNHLFKMRDNPKPTVSIVLPVYDEEDNLPETFKRLTQVLDKIDPINGNFELVFVNDGSRDHSAKFISEFREIDSRVKLVNLSRNFGHQAAITAGIDFCHGDAVILMDADLQDPPEVLSEMIEQWLCGTEVVYAVRQERKENFLKKGAYFVFYRLLQFISHIEIPLDSV